MVNKTNMNGKLVRFDGIAPLWEMGHMASEPPDVFWSDSGYNMEKIQSKFGLIIDDTDPEFVTLLIGEQIYFTVWSRIVVVAQPIPF